MKVKNRKLPRAKWWDYSAVGSYFVTICTKDKKCYFGNIQNENISLSPTGIIADVLWLSIEKLHKNIKLGSFIVMPNHIHGVIHILENELEPNKLSISTLIGVYKAEVSKNCRRLGFPLKWQSSFFDVIIRNEQHLEQIEEYIYNNPIAWAEDK